MDTRLSFSPPPKTLGTRHRRYAKSYPIIFIASFQDDLLAELEEMEQEELEKDLLEVETPSDPVEDSLGLDELPEVRK